jgi:hypothetical protein
MAKERILLVEKADINYVKQKDTGSTGKCNF